MNYRNPFCLSLATLVSWGIALFTSTFMHGSDQKEFKIILEPKWEILDDKHTAQFGGTWILAGSITFKKKAKECVHLTKLHLAWNGPFLDKVTASLYEHNFEKKFYPIEDFFVSDGKWNRKTQTLHFTFNEKCTLQAINTFYLVLTVPGEQEPLFRQGSFCISDDCLPDQLKEHINDQELSLSLNSIGNSIQNSIHKNIHKNPHKKIALASH